MKPRLMLVARTRYTLPLSRSLERKFDALGDRFDLRVLATSATGRPVHEEPFHLVPRLPLLDGLLFWVLLPWRVRREARRFRPDAILVQSPYEAAVARLARTGRPIIAELHGDWRTATRLYGSPHRRLLSGVADAVARWGVRRAESVRTLSPFTSGLVRGLGREPDGEFVAYMDLGLFLEREPVPLPEQAGALYVGVLELYKNLDGLAEAWRNVAGRLPDVQLRLVGDGSRRDIVEALVRELPSRTTWTPRLPQEEIVRALDSATVLLLPSRSEGLPRIVVEALCRGRPVVATRVGGIPDAVVDGVNGLLVDDDEQLADALVRVLSDRALAERLAAGAAASAAAWYATAADYAARVEELVRPYTVSP